MNRKLARALPAALFVLPTSWALAQIPEKTAPAQGGGGVAVPATQDPATKAPAGTPQNGAATTATKATGAQTPATGTKTTGTKTAGTKTTGGKTTTATQAGKAVAGAKAVQGGAPGARGAARPAKPAWQQFPLNPNTRILLDFTESNPDAVISLFSRTSGITILKMPQFKTPITLTSAKAISLNEAFTLLNTVLSFQNYEIRKQGNFLLVAMKQPPQQPPMQAPPAPPQPEVKTYTLQNAKASDVAKVIVDIYGPAAGGGGQPQGGGGGEMMFVNGRMVPMNGGGGAPGGGGSNPNFKVTSDEFSNTIVVKAMPDEHTKIDALIKDLDKSTSATIITEIIKLDYVPADQAVTAIEDILTANQPTGRRAGRQTPQQPDYGYYGYYGYGGGSRQRTAGAQSATAIKASNSVSVNATPENIKLIKDLLKNLDQPANFVDTTNVIKLLNAKATDVADLLTKAFAQQRNQNSDFGFFIFDSYGGGGQNNRQPSTDYDENGRFVNIRDIQGKVNIQADPNTNSIVVVTIPSNMRAIRKVIDQLDMMADQVVIETVVVEANLDKTLKLGVEYNFIGNLFGGNGVGRQNFGIQNGTGVNTPSGATYTLSGDDYNIFLNAVQTDSRFKVLDTPRIFTSNNVKATINVGQSVPYPRNQNVTTVGVTTQVDFQEVGVILEVTPRITANGRVTMDVVQSANDVAEFQNFNNASAPLVNTRRATTTVSVDDGQTVVLGGIIQQTEQRVDQKVPLLGDIPLIGQLFRSTNRVRGQSELMVFLTPHVIRSNADAQRIRRDSTNDLTKPSQNDLKRIIPPAKQP